MSDYLYTFASLGFIVWIARNVLYWGNVFQSFSYSFPRVKTYLLTSSNGRKTLFSPVSLIKWLILAVYPYIIFHETFLIPYHIVITILYGYELVIVIKEAFLSQRMKRDVITMKTIIIIISTFLIGLLLFLIPPLDKFLWLVFLDRAIVFFICCTMLLFSLPEEFYLDYRMLKVSERLKQQKKLQSILFIGGEEVELMKQSAVSALKEKKRVMASEKYADKKTILTLLKKMSDRTEVFLTQTTQLTRTELEQMLTLLKPEWIIISSLPPYVTNAAKPDKELELFSELLLRNAKRNQTILSTGDIPSLRKVLRRKGKHVTFFSTSGQSDSSVIPESVQLSLDKTVFTFRGTRYDLPLVSSGSINLALPLLVLFQAYTVSTQVIKKSFASFSVGGAYFTCQSVNGVVLISHTGAIDETDVLSFSPYMQQFQGKKVITLDTDILSRVSPREVEKLGKQLAGIYQYVFLLPSPNAQRLKTVIDKTPQPVHVQISSEAVIQKSLASLLSKGDSALCYGAGTRPILQRLMKKKRKEKTPSGL